MRQSKCFS